MPVSLNYLDTSVNVEHIFSGKIVKKESNIQKSLHLQEVRKPGCFFRRGPLWNSGGMDIIKNKDNNR
ncbi:hypothetical protein M5C99_12275 [Acidovorax sp. NCPPB 2350]|nr:hypothetical protein M5C99_12275 [Acidovorax sp. NCPPB 2350]